MNSNRPGLSLLFLSLALAFGPLEAATFLVDDLADSIDSVAGDGLCETGSGSCSLRAAVMEANALPGADLIELPEGLFVLTLSGVGDVGDDLDILEDLEISGAGPQVTVLDANLVSRAFLVVGGVSLTIRQLALSPGASTPSTEGSAFLTEAAADLTLVDFHLLSALGEPASSALEHRGSFLGLERVDFINSLTTVAGIAVKPEVSSTSEIRIYQTHFSEFDEPMVPLVHLAPQNGADVVAELKDSEFSGWIGVGVEGADLTETSVIVNISHCRFSKNARGVAIQAPASSAGLRAAIFVQDSDFRNGVTPLPLEGAAIWAQSEGSEASIDLNRVAVSGLTRGLFVEGPVDVKIKNSSFDSGRVVSAVAGSSAISPTIEANNVTLVGELNHHSGGPLTIHNSIIAGRCANFAITGSGNIFTDPIFCSGDTLPIGDPMLGNLMDNGGPTRTMALLPGSDAIDAGSPLVPGSGGTACESTDQRGLQRPTDGDGIGPSRCDAGAYEVGSVTVFDDGFESGDFSSWSLNFPN